MMPNRQTALAWWNQLPEGNKQLLCNEYYVGREYSSLTGREIEGIWGAESQFVTAPPAPPVHQEQGAQENVKGTTGCQLSNSELIRSLREWNSKLCNTGGSAWSLQVPVSLDKDPDILIEEICQRLVAMESYRTQSTEVKTQGPEELLEALQKIQNPVAYLQNSLKEGERLDGVMAVALSNDANWLKEIARKAIDSYKSSPSHTQPESAGIAP